MMEEKRRAKVTRIANRILNEFCVDDLHIVSWFMNPKTRVGEYAAYLLSGLKSDELKDFKKALSESTINIMKNKLTISERK